MPTDVQRATTDLRQHPHAQFFRDNPTFEPVRPEPTGPTAVMTAEKRHQLPTEDSPCGGATGLTREEFNACSTSTQLGLMARSLGEVASAPDLVNHPPHYTSDPSGVECIQITRHRNFNIGNAIKYLWRNGLKESGSLAGHAKQIEDLKKAAFYINDEIKRLEATR